METSHERRSGRPWDDSYREGHPPWDTGAPRSTVLRLRDSGAFVAPVLDAGCGSGENALAIAEAGIEVLGVDLADTAIRQARAKAADRGVAATFEVADALRLEGLGRTFRTVLDSGLFHTFDDDERATYVESLAAVTAQGGVLHLMCFSDAAPGDWGPRRIREEELRASFRAGWRVASIEADHLETAFGDMPAWLATFERI